MPIILWPDPPAACRSANIIGMAGVQQRLVQICELIRTVRPADAETALDELFETLGPSDIRVWQQELESTINLFTPKRRRQLMARLQVFLDTSRGGESELTTIPAQDTGWNDHDVRPSSPPGASSPVAAILSSSENTYIRELESTLRELSDRHLFQWSTYYRSALTSRMGAFFELSQQSPPTPHFLARVRETFANHAREIYGKGYAFSMPRDGRAEAVAKSYSGLTRFLDLAVEYYSTRLPQATASLSGSALRTLTSAVLSGVLVGYARTDFGSESGAGLLAGTTSPWMHTIGLLSSRDLQLLTHELPRARLAASLERTVLPVSRALDHHARMTTGTGGLPAASTFDATNQELIITLARPGSAHTAPLEISCILAGGPWSAISSAAARGASMVLVELDGGPPGQAFDERLEEILVRTDLSYSREEVQIHVQNILKRAIYQKVPPRRNREPLAYNFATRFPLQDPHLTVYWHVPRPSVNDLQRTFERRNGVRLWCSVRRSGKTQAGIDLGQNSGATGGLLITQTCDDTGQIPGGGVMWRQMKDALLRGDSIPDNFLVEQVRRVSPPGWASSERCVLVIDEYETLFGAMREAMKERPLVRYNVVQPILNQMVAFAKGNLIVFMGQQPTAHNIIMDQNQLAPYVLQEPFPLFVNGKGMEDEFGALLGRIMSDRVTFTTAFKNAVYEETAGHPYLTVNILVRFFDWLIERKHPSNRLSFDRSDFEAFVDAALTRRSLLHAEAFWFFRENVATPALSPDTAKTDPWLYSIYTMLRALCQFSGDWSVSETDFVELVHRYGIQELGISARSLLNTGVAANFFAIDRERVRPKIRILGRLAAIA